jgi:hypothetical protein
MAILILSVITAVDQVEDTYDDSTDYIAVMI